jgi:hypothetical protein
MLTTYNVIADTPYGPGFLNSMRMGSKASAVMYDVPECIIVVNGGKPVSWRATYGSLVPILSDLAGLKATTGIMYNNTQRERIRLLQLQFAKGEITGAVVDMAENGVEPASPDCIGQVIKRRNIFLERERQNFPIQDIISLVKANGVIPTTLRPLGLDRTIDLLRHGYLQAMVSLHIRLDYPLLQIPERSRFANLVNKRRLRLPEPNSQSLENSRSISEYHQPGDV